ncbi:8-oxo-dGTP pyrophosphatase MutT (NUDIX family) [Deinococcus sp. UYEF24]
MPPEQAAVREAWEECGATAKLTGPAFLLRGESGRITQCFPASLIRLTASPEGRPLLWVDPRVLPWRIDVQILQGLEAQAQRQA